MICEKCGKSNISDLSECAYCGAKMPKTSGGGGFADILSYNAAGGVAPAPVRPEMHKDENEKTSEGISELDMQKLMKKSDNIMKSTKINSLFGLVAIGLSLLILISSIIFGIVTINTVKGYKEETMTQIDETRKELIEYKTQVDTLIEESKKKDDVTDDNDVTTTQDDKSDTKQENKDSVDKDDKKDTGKKNDDVKNPSSPKTDAEGNLIN